MFTTSAKARIGDWSLYQKWVKEETIGYYYHLLSTQNTHSELGHYTGVIDQTQMSETLQYLGARAYL